MTATEQVAVKPPSAVMQRISAMPPSTAVTMPPSTVATCGSLLSQITVLIVAAPMPNVPPCGATVPVSEAVEPGVMESDVVLRVTPVACVFTKET